MDDTKVDKDYIEAFNQGYEVAKELGLKPDALNGISAGNNRIQAMKEGMEQYVRELTQEKEKDIIPSFDMDNLDKGYVNLEGKKKDKNKDRDLEL